MNKMTKVTLPPPDINRLVSKLRIKVNPKIRKFKAPIGPENRLLILRQTVSALFKYERIELNYPRADEARGFAERLISEAIRHGDSHKPTMDMATYWLPEKQLIHKLFKVLAPRYSNYQSAFTSLYKAPLQYEKSAYSTSVLELKGNPFPPLVFDGSRNKNFIHNVLLDEARKEFKRIQSAEIAAKVSTSEKKIADSTNVNESEGETRSKAAVDVSEGEHLLKSSILREENSSSSKETESKTDPLLV